MKKYGVAMSTFFLTLFVFTQTAERNLSIDEVVAKMTLEQKAKLVVGRGMRFPGAPQSNDPAVGQTEDRVPGAAGSTI
jgi:hypothetical protein